MSDRVLDFFAHRSLTEAPGPDITIRLTVTGSTYIDSFVSVVFEGQQCIYGSQLTTSSFFRSVIGKPARQWPELAEKLNLQFLLQRPLESLNTVEQGLFKALFLVYLWVEPNLWPNKAAPWDTLLFDEFIVDFTGRPGTQPFIYFPPKELQEASANQLQRLYDLTLLCRLEITDASGKAKRFFKPLNVPGLLIAKFDPDRPNGGPTYALWSMIRHRMQQKVQGFVNRSAS